VREGCETRDVYLARTLVAISLTHQAHANSNNADNSANGDRIHCPARDSYLENTEHSASELVRTRNPEFTRKKRGTTYELRQQDARM